MSKQARLLSLEAINYTWRQLAQRAGVTGFNQDGNGFDKLDLPLFYADPSQVQASTPGIIVVPFTGNWFDLLERAPATIDWLSTKALAPPNLPLSIETKVPVLFWSDGYPHNQLPPVTYRADGMLIFGVDIIATTFFMLSRWEETVAANYDEHGRFVASTSVAVRQDFLCQPIVDEYAQLLQSWLRLLKPNWQPIRSNFRIQLSHDIDWIRKFKSTTQVVNRLGGDLIKRRSLGRMAETLTLYYLDRWQPDHATPMMGINQLASWSEQFGLASAFYFMTATPSQHDIGYNPATPYLLTCIDDLQKRGHEIGFHPGYTTYGDLTRFSQEKNRFDQIFGIKSYGGRQHYLRFRTPETWRHWEYLGLAYDSTLTYAEQEGFRCGTCHPYRPFDIEQNRELNLIEIPLIVMDNTLHQYRKLQPDAAINRVMALAERCRQVGGIFTLLWHNSSFVDDWRVWQAQYPIMLSKLAELKA